MKAIIKTVFLTAILALVVTGCQKEGDDLEVSLKSTIAFTGGVYISDWSSGNAEAECALAGGCDGGSYKIDSGVDAGVYFNEGGVTVTGINKQKFSWTSIYPVCKIIVKAGRGAYIFDIDGALSGTVPYPTNLGVKEKDISHITFCFDKQPEPVVIAIKASYWLSYTSYENSIYSDLRYTCSTGTLIYPASEIECNVVGINYYPGTSSFPLLENVGNVTIEESNNSLIITVDLNDDFVWNQTSLYLGNLAGLGDLSTCPVSSSWPYQNEIKQNTHVYTIPY